MGRFTFLRVVGNTNHRKLIRNLSANMKLVILLTILAVAYSAPVESEVASGEIEVASGEIEMASGEIEMASGENEMASGEIEMASGEVEMASSENEMASGENEMASGDVEAVLEVFDEINFAARGRLYGGY